jgi:hypothetical protein
MLSRLSSFSGPFSATFRIPGGFTLNGLILRYIIGDTDSYSGTNTVTDLRSNSNATLVNGPTYSINGYLNFDGSNDYLITNTSLNSKLSPPTTSTVISFFCWIYLQDNGVIISEQGTTTPDSNWFDSQIELVSGTLRFSVWPYSFGTSKITSSISTPLNNWYYVGLTYDGTTLRAYVNGSLAGSSTYARQTPSASGLYYTVGFGCSTNQGDGTYAKLKMGDFHVYNTALSNQQILNNYNATKNNYIYTGSMSIWIDANDPASFSGGLVNDLSGNGYTHTLTAGATLSNIDGIKCFDCATGSKRIAVSGTGPTLSTTGYTYVVWARLGSDISSFRTLLYTKSPRYTPITIPDSTHPDANKLGYWDTNSRSSGYDISSLVGVWAQYSVVGDNSSQTFYINDYQVGSSIPYGSGGTLHDGLGNNLGSSQPFGHVGNMMLYNKKLTQEQIKQNYNALKHVYTPGFVTNDLLLMLDANETSSYPGSGTIWYDIAGSSQNMTLVNSPTFVSGTVSYFDFNGTTQFATGTGVTVPTTAYTKSVWFWVDTYVANNIVSGFNNVGGHFLYMGNSTKILVGHHNQGVAFDTYQSISSISLNTWYNVTVTFNTTSGFKIYINGQLDSSHNMILAHLGSGTTNLGAYSNSGDNFMNGRISKVYTYGRALTESEVEQNFFYDREKFGIEVLETFTTVGSTTWTAPIGVTSVEYLVVAGGGGAGNGFDNAGGGGGAGGMVLTGTINVTPGQSYTITVGDGGIGGDNARANNAGTDGENSVFGSITALGGGRGQGSRTGGLPGAKYTDVSAATGGAGSGGGFGGKGGGGVINGFNNSGTTGGAGGNGVSSSISGTSVTYGAGGAGGNAGTQNSGVNGTSNRGNGGRAGGAAAANSTGGGNGGSGIVVIKY